VVKLIQHKATSPPHMDGTVIFARCANVHCYLGTPVSIGINWCCRLVSCLEYIWAFPVPTLFRPQNCLFACDLDPI